MAIDNSAAMPYPYENQFFNERNKMLALIGVLGFAFAALMVVTAVLAVVSVVWEVCYTKRKDRRMQRLVQSIKQELAAEQQHP